MPYGRENWEILDNLVEIVELQNRYKKNILTGFDPSNADIGKSQQQVLLFLKTGVVTEPSDLIFYTEVANTFVHDYKKEDIKLHYISRAVTQSKDIRFVELVQYSGYYDLFSQLQKDAIKKHFNALIQKQASPKQKSIQKIKTDYFKDAKLFPLPVELKVPVILHHQNQVLIENKVTPYHMLGIDEQQQLRPGDILKEYDKRVGAESVPEDRLKLLQAARDILLYIKKHPEKKQYFECLKQSGRPLKY